MHGSLQSALHLLAATQLLLLCHLCLRLIDVLLLYLLLSPLLLLALLAVAVLVPLLLFVLLVTGLLLLLLVWCQRWSLFLHFVLDYRLLLLAVQLGR